MAETVSGAAGGYVAFISYSHKDSAAGRWLHRKLEGYRLPRRLVGTQGDDGEVPERLTPIFRDRDELPAAGDLSERVRAALAVSRNLIVLCSPNSAASPWVAKEIATFRELHPGRPVFTAIVEGEPGQCFSPALLEGGVEPLAADLRKEGDGRRLGLLKLVAGLTGVPLDALVQRDTQRRLRRVTAVTVAAVAAMLAMALLTAFALNARGEAERQRAEAEGLVEFMLTDLRDKLEGVGRLDVLTAANQRALDYYVRQDIDTLSTESLERRARILQAMGEDDLSRDKIDRALAQFREAARTTAALLASDPDNPDRIFAHSQSEFWIGRVDYDRERFVAATPAFQEYRNLTARLIQLEPGNPKYLQEAAFAEGNLCSLALEEPVDIPAALRRCRTALSHMEEAARRIANPPETAKDLANRHGWMADAYRKAGSPADALRHRQKQLQFVELALGADPENVRLQAKRLWAMRGLANIEAEIGRPAEAAARMAAISAQLSKLVAADRENVEWRAELAEVNRELATMRSYNKKD